MTYYYQATTYTSGSANLPIEALCNVAGSAGYTFVESLTANNHNWAIYKSPSSLNGKVDFYLGFSRNTSAFYGIAVFEEWNTSSKTAIGWTPQNTAPDTSNWRCSSPQYLPGSSSAMFYADVQLVGATEFNVWGKSKIIVAAAASSINPPSGVFKKNLMAGVFESFLPSSADPFPVYVYATYSIGLSITTDRDGLRNCGKFVRTAGRNSAGGFNFVVAPLNMFNILPSEYTNTNNYAKSLIIQIDTWAVSQNLYSKDPVGIRGYIEDLYFGVNSDAGINKQSAWTFAGSQYYGRNINLHILVAAGRYNGNDACLILLE